MAPDLSCPRTSTLSWSLEPEETQEGRAGPEPAAVRVL